jgi:hypothetical protein
MWMQKENQVILIPHITYIGEMNDKMENENIS